MLVRDGGRRSSRVGFVFHPAVPHAVPEVPQADDSQVPVVNLRERLPTRRLVLVGGRTRSQNVFSPEAQEEQIGALASLHRSQVGQAQAVRAPVDVDHQGRVPVAREADVNRGRDPRPERDAAPGADFPPNVRHGKRRVSRRDR